MNFNQLRQLSSANYPQESIYDTLEKVLLSSIVSCFFILALLILGDCLNCI